MLFFCYAVLKFDQIPIWGVFILTFGGGLLSAIVVKYAVVPWQRRRILGKIYEFLLSDNKNLIPLSFIHCTLYLVPVFAVILKYLVISVMILLNIQSSVAEVNKMQVSRLQLSMRRAILVRRFN